MSNLSTFHRLISFRCWMPSHLSNASKYSARRYVSGRNRPSTRLPITTLSPSSFGTSNFHFLHRNYTTSTKYYRPFPKDYYQPYKRAVTNILSSKEFTSEKASLLGQGLWSEAMFQKFERWLLQTKPAVDEQATWVRWSGLRKKWMAGIAPKSKKKMKESKGNTKQSLSCVSDLSSQCEALQSNIFTTSSDHHNKENTRLVSQSFSRMVQFIFQKLVDYCLEGANSQVSILPVVWYKMKESGVVLNRPKLRVLLNVMIERTSTSHNLEQSTRKDIPLEELVMYHDLLSGEVSEESFYQRYPAMLIHHCELGDTSAALSLMRKIKALPSSPFKHDHYMLVLATLAENGYFRNDASFGSTLFDEIAADMAAQAWEITPSSAMRLHNALVKEFENLYPPEKESTVISTLKEWNTSEDIAVRDLPVKDNELLACRVEIDPSNWICPVTNTQLRSYSFKPANRKQIEENILDLVQKQSVLVKELKKFSDWLNKREGPPFTVFLDGANMGSSIESMMADLDANGHTSLAILPEKLVFARQRSLKNRGKIYVVADGSYDDLFCMIATVSEQKQSHSIHSNPPLPETPAVLLTNDRFRDHESEMRDSELVRQWRRYHCRRHSSLSGKMKKLPPIPSKRIDWNDVHQLYRNHCDGHTGLSDIMQNHPKESDMSKPDMSNGGDTPSHLSSVTPHQREQIFEDILALAQKKSTAANDLKAFLDWLDNRKGHPFTIILDGANIGSVESMVANLEAKGEYPLVILPETFATVSHQRLSVADRLRNSGKLYIVPDWHDDDLYCIIATLSDQKTPCSNHLSGVRPLLITNDAFHNHRKKMRDPALFREWYSHHCYKHKDGSLKKLSTKVFSRRIEQNDWPNNNEGNASHWAGKVWHFPVSGWGFNGRFVVRLPTQSKNIIPQNK